MERKDVEVILVDNGSQDDTVHYISDHYPSIRLIPLQSNKGVAFARNRAIEQATGQYAFILDNDTIMNDEAAEGLESYLDTHPSVGLVACQLVNDKGERQDSYKSFPGLRQKFRNFFNLPVSHTQPVYVIGACQMVRKEIVDRIGLLDESIFYGPEDCDFCLRIQQAGWEIAYVPQFTIIHLCQRITHNHIFSPLTCQHIKGLFYFYRKHHRWL